MPNVLVLYYSSYGHIELMAQAQAEGAARVKNARVTIQRVAEIVPPDLARASGFKLDQAAPIASPDSLDQYDAIIFSTPTRFGNMAAQMRNFLDQTGALWGRGALVGKLGSVFCSTASQHGGQETTITSFHTNAAAPRDAHRGAALHVQGSSDDARGHRRHPLRRQLRDRCGIGAADAEWARARHVSLPGRARRAPLELSRCRRALGLGGSRFDQRRLASGAGGSAVNGAAGSARLPLVRRHSIQMCGRP